MAGSEIRRVLTINLASGSDSEITRWLKAKSKLRLRFHTRIRVGEHVWTKKLIYRDLLCSGECCNSLCKTASSDKLGQASAKLRIVSRSAVGMMHLFSRVTLLLIALLLILPAAALADSMQRPLPKLTAQEREESHHLFGNASCLYLLSTAHL